VLQTIDPLAFILATVGVGVGAFTMLFVESVVSFVFSAVLPHVDAISVHDATLEVTFELTSVGPLERPVAAHLVVFPCSTVLGPISPVVHAVALLDTLCKVAVVVAAIAPHLDTHTILLLILHLSSECSISSRVFSTVGSGIGVALSEHAEASSAILLPEAFEDVIVLGTEHTEAASLAINPEAFEGARVGPNQLSISTLDEFLVCRLVVDIHVVSGAAVAGVSLLLVVFTLLATLALLSRNNALVARSGLQTHLAHVLEGTELHRLKLQLFVLQAETLVLLLGFIFLFEAL